MKLQVIGTGCSKCKILEENTRKAVSELGIQAEVVKVTDMDEILNLGVMVTPALAIDGNVKSAGKVLTKDQVIQFIKGV